MSGSKALAATFPFGRNWQRFVERELTPEREQQALASLKQFLKTEDLRGQTFLDIGCGSGLFSLAAVRLGAREVVSFDVDPFSVQCSAKLRENAGNPANWKVLQGSVLDNAFLARLEPADIVYAWGCLHHTGNMWQAIRNAAALVAPGGRFYLAIYNKVSGRGGSEYWLNVKKFYNRSPRAVKFLLEAGFVLRNGVLRQVIRFRNPFTYLRDYGKRRGMSYWTDVRDWLGGYPYEYASADELLSFCAREFGMELVNMRTTETTGNNELLFQRRMRARAAS